MNSYSLSAFEHDHATRPERQTGASGAAKPLARAPFAQPAGGGAAAGQTQQPRRFAVMPSSSLLLGAGGGLGPRGGGSLGYSSAAFSYSNLQLNVPLREPSPVPIKEETSSPPPVVEVKKEEPEEEEDGQIDVQVRNVVCNYTLPLHIDLRRLALNSNNVTFDRGRGVLMKQKRNPFCYVKIYSSGKVYIVGCRSEDECMRAARNIARNIQRAMGKLGETVRIGNYRICNVLATCKMPFGVRIEDLAKQYPSQTSYEPELNVGLIWRNKDPKATLRIHTTGSVSVTGAASEAAVMTVIEMIYPILKQFRCASRTKEARAKRAQTRKRQAPLGWPARAPVKREFGGPSGESGMYGNQVHFSDEDDLDMIDEDEEEM